MENEQRPRTPHIDILHSRNTNSALAVANSYDIDRGPLSMPVHIYVGGKTWDRQIIQTEADQICEFDVWLEDMIKAENQEVLTALDEIYGLALGAGVILMTTWEPQPNITHAHIVRRVIMDMAP